MRNKKQVKKKSQIRNILRTDRSEYYKLKRIFSSLSLSEIRSCTRELHQDQVFSKYVNLQKSNYTSRIYDYSIPETPLEKSLYWSMGVFINNIEKLRIFNKLEQEISDCILNDNLNKAVEILDEIDNYCGISTWSISLRSSILIESGERSKLNTFLERILSGIEPFSMFYVIVKHTVNKNDSNDSIQENRTRIDRQLRTSFYLDSIDLYYFLKYKTLSFKPTDDYNFEHILNIEKNSTLIDLYICCSDFLTYSLSHDIYKEVSSELTSVLGHHLPNSIFDRCSDLFKLREKWSVDPYDVDLLDNYTRGNYEYCYNKIIKSTTGLGFSHIEIAAKSACRLSNISKTNNKDKVISLLRDFLLKKSNYHNSKNELYRIQNKFRDLYIFKKMFIFIELSEVKLNQSLRQGLKRTLYIISKINSPFRSEFILPASRNKFIETMNLANYNDTSLIWNLYQGNVDYSDPVLDSICFERKLSYYCKCLMDIGETLKGQEKLSELVQSEDKLTSYEASNDLLIYLNENKMDLDVVELYNNRVLENRNYVYILDNDKAIKSAERILNDDLNIKAIITLSLISRYIDSSMSSKLRAIFNSLMRKHDCVDPLNINDSNEWNGNEFIYFLKYICTPKIMKFFRHFRNPTDIDKSRISICNYLIKVEKNKDAIENELKDITKKLVLREATLQVAQSKVDSDISSFRAGENVAHISSYEKYIEFVREDYDEFTKSMSMIEVVNILSDKNLGVTYLNSNKNFEEASATFIKLVRTIIEEFSFGEKGLNANVSTRIRHGHLPNTIRRSLLNENLITSISEQTKIVKNNDYWIVRLSDGSNGESISKILNNFTVLVNTLIHTINEEVLQVSTLDENLSKLSKVEKPLFSYKPSDLDILLLQKKINVSTTYNDFINIVESWLWEITQDNLESIRDYISVNVTDQIISNLISDVSNLVGNKNCLYDFTNAANRAKASFRKDVSTIISWFRKKEINAKNTFDLEIAVKIASQALLIDIDLERGSDIKIKGNKLSCFVDILYILYENSISKSGLDINSLNIYHYAKLENGILRIVFRNNCLPFDSVNEKNEEIQEYIDSYGVEEKMMQRLHSEGGTGFAKIWKVITKDLGCEHDIQFGFIDDDCFNVDINIYVGEML
ncbi:TPA: hypothetical protein NKU34_000673 [Vibrio parahaemolyticus]|nr:hypothetical protein [Vibrio parahaemolyticus]